MWMNLFTAALQAELSELLPARLLRCSLFFPVNKNPDEKFAPRTLHPFFMLSWTRKCREPSLLDHPLTSRRSQDHLAESTDFLLISIWRVFLTFYGQLFELLRSNVSCIVNSQSMENLVNVTSNLPWKKVGVVPINFPEVCEYWNIPVQLWPPFPLCRICHKPEPKAKNWYTYGLLKDWKVEQ